MTNRHRPRQQPTTLIVPPANATPTSSFSVFQGSGINTATELATSALPTQLVFDTSATGIPLGAVTTAGSATISLSYTQIGTVDLKSVVPVTSSAPDPTSSSTSTPSTNSSKNDLPVAAIAMAIIAAGAIASLLLFLWYRKRARRRGQAHSRVSSHDVRGPPAGDVLRKLGPTLDKSDPFSDAHAVDPFADPEKAEYVPRHNRSGSDSFLSMGPPRQPYTHVVSASTGSSASSKIGRKEAEESREKDMMALNNLVRALDHKERRAEQEGRERKSLPPVELFKAALVR